MEEDFKKKDIENYFIDITKKSLDILNNSPLKLYIKLIKIKL